MSNQKSKRKKDTPMHCKGIVVEALKQSFMDCQLSCTSTLPRIWVIETLARSNQVDISLLVDLLEKTPEISDDLGRNARELVSLRILESFFVQSARTNSVSSSSSQKIRLDPSGHCEDVLRRILTETSPSHLKPAGPEMWKWDLQPFIEHKRSSLAKYALQQLKDAILTGSHPFLSSIKEQSGLRVGNQPEHGPQVDEGNYNGITPRFEGNDTNGIYILHTDLSNENSVPITRKRRATSENAGGKSCKHQILLKNGCKTHAKPVKKYKQEVIGIEQYVGGKLVSSGVDSQLVDKCTVSMQHNEGEWCNLGGKTHVGGMELSGHPGDDNNECTSSKGLVGPDQVLTREKQVPHCEIALNNQSGGELGLDHDIEEAKGNKEDFCDLKTTDEDVDKFEPNMRRNAPNIGEVEEDENICGDGDGNKDDRTDIATNKNASFSRQFVYSQDSLETVNWKDKNLLADTSERIFRYSEEDRCSFGKKTRVGCMGQSGPPGDGNNECTSLKGLVGHDEVLPHEKQAPHHSTEVPHEIFDGEQWQDMDKFEQNIQRNIPNGGEAEEDVDISSDNDGYHDERTNIDTKKKTFLSSQCTYSQDSLAMTDWREQNLCVKCNKGGKLLVCSSNSCPLVTHESCLGSDASFDTRGKFYCPFCAYSRAISKYIEIKRKASMARKDLATFICLGTRKESKKHSCRSCRIKQKHLEQDDGLPKSYELNNSDFVKRVSNHQRRKKLEYEPAGPLELSSGYSPPFGGKAVDSTNMPHTSNHDKQEGKRTRQVSQSPKVHGQQQMAALAIHKSQGENTSYKVSDRSNGSEKHANIRSKKGVLCPPQTDLPHEYQCLPSIQSANGEEISEEENENSGASKYFIRVRKQERQCSYPVIPQLRRKRIPWTSAEEEILKEGMRLFCSPHDKIIPWKKILEFGAGVFQQSRTTMDLKDKWRNMCKATPKSS